MEEQQAKDRATLEREQEIDSLIDRDDILKNLKKENRDLYSHLQGKEKEIKDLEKAIVRLALRLKK